MPARKVQVSRLVSICNTLRNLAPFLQFKKREKHPWECYYKKNSSMGVFQVFKTVLMVPNPAKRLI